MEKVISKSIIVLFLIMFNIFLVSFSILSTSQQTTTITIAPSNTSQLVDVSQTIPPDALDPATGFAVEDGPFFTAVFQELVEFNGSNYLQVVPVIAQNWSTSNYENWTFYIRHGVYFPDGVQVNASTVWFSFYRTILMGQGAGISNYDNLLFNGTVFSNTGYAIPWGVNNAIQNVTGLPTANNFTLTAQVLASILSHFNAANKTIQKIMEYPYQAVVVKGPYEVQINTLYPYRYFLFDIADWWGAIVNPIAVDEHGGVQPNTPNAYINTNGMNGTGPYIILHIGAGMSTITLEKNPHYWAQNLSNIPSVAEPAHIPIIIIDYGLSHNDRVEDFANNLAQISYVSQPYLSQMYNAYEYNKYVSFNQIFTNVGYEAAAYFISLNTEVYPTNITDLRLALVYGINYSELLQLFKLPNGQLGATEYLGPISQVFPLYNEVMQMDNLHPYTYNLSLALHYLNEAGYVGKFYVVLPNGTVIGNPKGNQLQTLDIYAITPVTELEQEELNIIQQNLAQLGISVGFKYVLPSIVDGWLSPATTPSMADLGWYPDWPDPIFQELIAQTDVEFGGISGNFAWVNNSVLQNMYSTLPFITNSTLQTQEVAEAYKILYAEAPYIWLPNYIVYYFTQPYLRGFVWNQFDGYFYNMMYYQPYTVNVSTTSSTTSSSTSVLGTTTQITNNSIISQNTTPKTSQVNYTIIVGVIVIVIVIVIALLLVARGRR
ncbi:ABC transporter substrate-binding protein [Sulfolobus tengchongensis]|uniref:ABC transporter substrate-binding protein n=1 Tax=Sulfolobus tengchongensis TaxID=207809 RepID=A0AAX4KYB6_9CREN